jgi:hypothetical protein
LKLWPLIVDVVAGSDLPLASRLGRQRWCRLDAFLMSVRSACASLTAPSTLRARALLRRLAPTMGCAVLQDGLDQGGVRPGLACSINATVRR